MKVFREDLMICSTGNYKDIVIEPFVDDIQFCIMLPSGMWVPPNIYLHYVGFGGEDLIHPFWG